METHALMQAVVALVTLCNKQQEQVQFLLDRLKSKAVSPGVPAKRPMAKTEQKATVTPSDAKLERKLESLEKKMQKVSRKDYKTPWAYDNAMNRLKILLDQQEQILCQLGRPPAKPKIKWCKDSQAAVA